MANVRSFYGKKKHNIVKSQVQLTQVEEEKPETAHIVVIGPPIGRQEIDLENEMALMALKIEVSCELEVFNVQN